MRLPIIGFCEGDLCLFASVRDAESCIEAIDVEAGAWVAYDRDGRLLKLESYRRQEGPRLVRITAAEAEATHATELRRKLKRFAKTYARWVGEIESVLDTRSLEDLITWAERFRS